MPNNAEYIVNYQPIGRRVTVDPKNSLLQAAQGVGIDIASICGGIGICDSCKIILINGSLSKPTLEEEALFTAQELDRGYRLACQSYPQSDLVIEIPPESLTAPQRLQIEGQSQSVQVDPAVIMIELEITQPTITDLRSDSTRVREALIHAGLNRLSISNSR